MKRYLLLFLVLAPSLFSQEKPLEHVDFFNIKDIDFSVFNDAKYSNVYNQKKDKSTFLKEYFKVWNEPIQRITKEEYEEFFIYDTSTKSPCIGENYNPLNSKIISKISHDIEIHKQNIGTNIRLGITLETTNIRCFPTNEFCFKKVRNAGEGYPFDYFQSTTLWLGAPVSILATSNDGLWYFINSHNNHGWIETSSIAFVSKAKATEIQKMDFLTPINDKVVVKGKLDTVKIYLGSIFPTTKKNGISTILLPKKDNKNNVYFEEVSVVNKNFKQFPIQFNKSNVKHLLTELMGYKYTWGGLNKGRDCSSTLKDFYTPFGIWLPRNSGAQKATGKQIALDGTNTEKLTKILNKGVPFLSTLYKRGHIVLFLGMSKQNTPIIFQNVWGVKAFYKKNRLANLSRQKEKYGVFGIHTKEGITNTRFIIGSAVITNIEPSEKLNTFKNLTTESFLNNFNTLTIFK